MDITVPDDLLPLLRLLIETHLAVCLHQAQKIERTFGAGHPHAQKARGVLSEAQALQRLFTPAQQVAA